MKPLLLFLSFLVVSVAPGAERPPNFIIIFADDLGYGDLGCYGSEQIRTPSLDRMAEEGMRFSSFYAQPICGPSRAALMTGCYPLRVAERGNVKNVHPELHSEEITIAEILKEEGYATGCFGKWDLAKHSQFGFHPDLMPNHQGFDYFFGTPTSNDRRVDLLRNEEKVDLDADMSRLTQRYTDEVIQFITEHRDEPFFVYLPHTMPHTRLDASGQFKGKSDRGLYGDVVEEIDFSAGRILDTVRELELSQDTYVIFTSDNGPWLVKNQDHQQGTAAGDHGGSAGMLRSGKVSTWEGGVRVPCIVWAPGRVPEGATCDELSSTLDMLPTLASLAGGTPPAGRVIDGEDIGHLFRGEFEKANPDKVFYYYFLTNLQAVRQGPWKLHLARPEQPGWLGPFARNGHIHPDDDKGFPEPALYNLEDDLSEQHDVAAAHPEVVERLLALAEEARNDIGDHDRVGMNMRFFDPMNERPLTPPAAFLKRSAKKGK